MAEEFRFKKRLEGPLYSKTDELTLWAHDDGSLRTTDEDGSTSEVGAGGGGSMSGSLQFKDITFTEEAPGASHAITAADMGTNTFGIAGDQSAAFTAGVGFTVHGSTGNDTHYEVVSASFGGGTTTIIVTTGPFDNTADGNIVLDNPKTYTGTLVLPADGWLFGVSLGVYTEWSQGLNNGEGELHWTVTDEDDMVIFDAEQQFALESGAAFLSNLDPDWGTEFPGAIGFSYPDGQTITAVLTRSVGGTGIARLRFWYTVDPPVSAAIATAP